MISPFLAWNIRGIGNKPSQRCLRRHCRKYDVNLVAISEPKICTVKALGIMQRLGFHHFAANGDDHSKIWLF